MKRSFLLVVAIWIASGVTGQQVFTSFQEAGMVIGQPDFYSQHLNLSDSVTITPTAIAISSRGMLAIAEQKGGSVKIWYELPERNGQPADVEVGNPDFFDAEAGPNQFYAATFDGVAWSPDGDKLIASSGSENRVLIWNKVPEKNGQAADIVIGQNDFTTAEASTKKNRLDNPAGILVTPDGRLLIADKNNNRVLIWNTIPVTNDVEADIVIGQSGFNTATFGADADQLYHPDGLYLSGEGQLLVTNESSHSVFIYKKVPESDNEPATLVIGHNDFGDSLSGTSETSLSQPGSAVTTYTGKLAVAENGNNRIIIFNSIPFKNGARADIVLGQPDFYGNTAFSPDGKAGNNNLSGVSGVAADLNGRLWVAGSTMNRIMVFGNLPKTRADLSIKINQSDSVLCELSDIVYRIDLYNAGPDTAYEVVAAATFPLGFTLENSFPGKGSYNDESGFWQIPSIAPSESISLLLDGYVNEKTKRETFTSYAEITGSSAEDDDLRNNAASVTVTIQTVKLPDDPVVKDVILCGAEKTMLFADGSGTIEWYSEEDYFKPIAEGLTYDPGTLLETTTFYVKTHDVCPGNARVPLRVEVRPAYNITESVDVCNGSSYTFPDGYVQHNITSAFSHISRLVTGMGCDSTITTNVGVLSVFSFSDSVTVCYGESYTFSDGTTVENITSSFEHTSNLISSHECDSVIVTVIRVNPVFTGLVTDTVCYGDTYTFPEGMVQENIIAPVTHTSSLTGVNGCDSMITTELIVLPCYYLSETAAVCTGGSYVFPDGATENNVIAPVEHTSHLSAQNGCDSIIVTALEVNSSYELSRTIEVCAGDDYTFPDGTTEYDISAPLSHTSNLVSSEGCDSIITTQVDVNEVDVSVSQEGHILTANNDEAEYQWIDCTDDSQLAGETGNSFSAFRSGRYAVVIDQNGCVSTSECYEIIVSGLETDVPEDNILVYPNPFEDVLSIRLPADLDRVSVIVLDIRGQQVIKQEPDKAPGSVWLDVSSLQSGMYFLSITAEDATVTFKVFKGPEASF